MKKAAAALAETGESKRDRSDTGAPAVDQVTIPKKAPDAAPAPKHHKREPNHADREDTVAVVERLIRDYYTHFRTQPEREDFEDKAEKADAMYRLSLVNDASSDQFQKTDSNVPSASFLKRLRAITTEDKSIVLGSDALPVQYEAIEECPEYNEEEGRRIAEEQNLLLAYTMDRDAAVFKLGQAIFYTNKYGNAVVSVHWDRRLDKKRERVPVEKDEHGYPTRFEFQEKERVVADWPTLVVHDIKDVWFDARIDDMQKQRCVIFRSQCGIEDIWGKARCGEYVNVDQVDKSHLYQDDLPSEMLEDRKDNASEDMGSGPIGLFDRFDVFLRVAINKDGEFDPEHELPTWHWVTFIGNIEGGSPAVCVRLMRNPYYHGKLPCQLLHSHEDDKGAFHLGYGDILGPNYNEERTTLNQMIDNKTERNRKPLFAHKGSILGRSLLGGRNKIYWMRPGTEPPKEQEIQDTTANSLQTLAWLQRDGDEASGVTETVQGQALGGRASANEAEKVYRQGMKPTIDKAYYLADQLLPFYAEMVAELWRQYADPARIMALTIHGQKREIKPATLYGPLRTRVVSVSDFERNVVKQQEEAHIVNVTMGPLMQVAPGVAVEVLKQVFRGRKMQNVDEWPWPKLDKPMDYDAKAYARWEFDQILYGGQVVMPQPGQNHEAHLAEHRGLLAIYHRLPKDQQSEQRLAVYMEHIAMTEYMQQTDMAGLAGGAEQGQEHDGAQAQVPQGMPGAGATGDGEAAGDMMAAQAGAMVNEQA